MTSPAARAGDADRFADAAIDGIRTWFGIDPPAAAAHSHVAKLAGVIEVLDRLRDAATFDDQPADFDRELAAAAPASTAPASTAPPSWPDTAANTGALAELTLVDAAAAVARGDVCAVELLDACLANLDARDAELRITTWLDRKSAYAAAERADQRQRDGHDLGPLHGVPLAHKDLFQRAGAPCTCGSPLLRERRCTSTATVLERLDHAGAGHVAGLNMPEFARGTTGRNRTFGDCRNPWNPDFITGGSSSGSGAAVAARMTYAALGTDTGGSVRIPAAACGVTGLKPTATRVSRHGVMPLSVSNDCVGPLARTARDCARMLTVIAGRDERDPTSAHRTVPDYETTLTGDVRGVRLGLVAGDDEPVVAAAVADAVAVLRERGARVTPTELPLREQVGVFCDIVSLAEPTAAHAAWLHDEPHAYEPDIAARMYAGLALPATAYLEALRRRGAVLAAFCGAVFDEIDVLVLPTLPLALRTLADALAEDEGPQRGRLSRWSANTRTINYLGLPAVSVPCGFDANGCPIGMQLIGRPFDEATLLRVADAYQRDTHWHTTAPRAA